MYFTLHILLTEAVKWQEICHEFASAIALFDDDPCRVQTNRLFTYTWPKHVGELTCYPALPNDITGIFDDWHREIRHHTSVVSCCYDGDIALIPAMFSLVTTLLQHRQGAMVIEGDNVFLSREQALARARP